LIIPNRSYSSVFIEEGAGPVTNKLPVGGLHLSKVLKNTTNIFSKYNICSETFGHGMELYMIWKSADREKVGLVPKLPVERLRLSGGK
jgi:hypothetical protein